MQLIVFIGIPAAGKSTFYQRFLSHSHLRINLDMLKTRHREQLIFQAALASKTKTVIDNTNPSIEDRARYISPALAAGFEIVSYYFDTDVNSAIARNAQRVGKARIPIVGIKAKQQQLQTPRLDEGFSEIFQVHTLPDHEFTIQLMASNKTPSP